MYGDVDDMDEELELFVAQDDDYSEPFQVDPAYEFDAARFFDFTRPESSSEAEQAQRWFCYAGNYPCSPLIMKLKWREDIILKNAMASKITNHSGSMISSTNSLDSNTDMDSSIISSSISLDSNMGSGARDSFEKETGTRSWNGVARDIQKSEVKPSSKCSNLRTSTLMKPTASHLAKMNQVKEFQRSLSLGRLPKLSKKVDERSPKPCLVIDRDATKRQKLEDGYLRKVAHLNHQRLLLHKLTNVQRVVASTVSSRSKKTVPREPNLATADRALRNRCRSTSEADDHSKPAYKASPLNKKILKNTSLPPPRKSPPQSPVFEEFHFKTSERAMHHSRANAVNRQNSTPVSKSGTRDSKSVKCKDTRKQEKGEKLNRVGSYPQTKKIMSSRRDASSLTNPKEARTPRVSKCPDEDRLSCDPPTKLLSELSLEPKLEGNATCRSKPFLHAKKGSTDKVPGSIRQELRGF